MVLIEVIGVDPPCKRCATTQQNVEQAANELRNEGLEVTTKKLDISSKDTISKYGIILTPAIALNGKVRVAGRIASSDEIIKIIKEMV
ncbi:MAG: thioredoxin family protein [Candidatus Bathyarchaeia archaeon]